MRLLDFNSRSFYFWLIGLSNKQGAKWRMGNIIYNG